MQVAGCQLPGRTDGGCLLVFTDNTIVENWQFQPRLDFFDYYGGAVGEDFGDAAHDFVGVVADGDDGVGSELGGVEGHHGEGVLAGLFAELGEEGDVSADQGLQACADGGEDVAGADDDAADDAVVADDAVAGDLEGGGDEGGVEGVGLGVGKSTFGLLSPDVARDCTLGGVVGFRWRGQSAHCRRVDCQLGT